MGERVKRAPQSWRAVRRTVYPVAPGDAGVEKKLDAEGGREQRNGGERVAAKSRAKSKNLARTMTGLVRPGKRLAQHTARVREAGFELHDAFDVSQTRHHVSGGRRLREVRGDGSRRDARAHVAPNKHLVFFCYLLRSPGICRVARKKTRRRDPGPRDVAPSSLTRPPSRPPSCLPPQRARRPAARTVQAPRRLRAR